MQLIKYLVGARSSFLDEEYGGDIPEHLRIPLVGPFKVGGFID